MTVSKGRKSQLLGKASSTITVNTKHFVDWGTWRTVSCSPLSLHFLEAPEVVYFFVAPFVRLNQLGSVKSKGGLVVIGVFRGLSGNVCQDSKWS